MTERESVLRVLTRVALHVAIAMGMGAVLLTIGIGAYLAVAGNELAPEDNPLSRRLAHEIDVSAMDAPEAMAALARARALGLARRHYELEQRDDGVWLVTIEPADATDRLNMQEVTDGHWTGKVVITRQAHALFQRAVHEPGATLQRFGVLTFWMIATTGLGFLVTGFVLRRRYAGDEADAPDLSAAARLVRGVGLGVIAVACSFAIDAAWSAAGLPSREQAWIVEFARGDILAYLGLCAVVIGLAPVAEETFFRGHVFRYVGARSGRAVAYAASAALFAAAHANPAAALDYLLYAVLFAWGYERWRSLLVPIAAHTVVNATSVVLLRFA